MLPDQAACIPGDNRIVVIEETAEIHLDKPNLLRFEAGGVCGTAATYVIKR